VLTVAIIFALVMEAVSTIETSVTIYEATQHKIPQLFKCKTGMTTHADSVNRFKMEIFIIDLLVYCSDTAYVKT
jgi:hypothetical protein